MRGVQAYKCPRGKTKWGSGSRACGLEAVIVNGVWRKALFEKLTLEKGPQGGEEVRHIGVQMFQGEKKQVHRP